MDLNNIQLFPIVLHGLFKNSLLESPDDIQTGRALQDSSDSILGSNEKNILIIIENDELYVSKDELIFLSGILSACHLSMEDVAILNIKHKSINYKSITTELKPEKLLLFGVSPHLLDLPLNFPYYQIQYYNNQTYLTAPPLMDLQTDKVEKTKLWNCLKKIFSI